MPLKKQQNLNSFFQCIPSFIEGDNNVTLIQSLGFSKLKIILSFIFLNVLFPLLIYWSLRVRKFLLFSPCALNESTYFWVENKDGSHMISKKFIKKIKRAHDSNTVETIAFCHKKLIYHFDSKKNVFKVLELDIQIVFAEILKQYGAGLTEELYEEYKNIYGECFLDIRIPNTLQLFIQEIFSPINFLQILCLILWCINDYVIYAIVVFVLSVCSAILNLIIIRTHFQNLKSMSAYESEVEVIRVKNYQKEKVKILSKFLVPGDVIVLRNGFHIPCDCILLNNHVVANEINITGEAIPKIKPGIPYTEKIYSIYDKKHTLFDGTWIAQVQNEEKFKETLALVIRTGFYTVKGELFRNIIYSTQKRLVFLITQIFKYIIIMFTLAIIGNVIKLAQINSWEDKEQMALQFLDLITVAIAPALPTCIFIGIFLSIRILKQKMISCYSPYRLLTTGSIDYLFLDKTGTITEKDLLLNKILIAYDRKFQESISKTTEHLFQLDDYTKSSTEAFKQTCKEIFILTASCHNIVEIQYQDERSELMGDNIDLKMFEFSQANLHFFHANSPKDKLFPQSLLQITSPFLKILANFKKIPEQTKKFSNSNPEPLINKGDESEMELISANRPENREIDHQTERLSEENLSDEELHTLKVFEFTSELQRMSILLYSKASKVLKCYVKGSPEVLKGLCLPDFLPEDYNKKLLELTKNGYVVLSLAYKVLDFGGDFQLSIVERQNCESKLIFLGFLVFENSIKKDSLECFQILNDSGVDPKILTGDSSTTTLVVAHKLGLVKDLNNTVLLDYQDQKLLLQKDLFSMEEKPVTQEFSTFIVNLDKDVHKNYDRLFLMKSVSPDSQNYMFLAQQPITGSPRKQIFSASTPFLKEFFSQVKNIIDSDIVITGKAFHFLYMRRFDSFTYQEKKIMQILLRKIKMFSRMLPIDKANLIKIHQKLGFLVGMVGDGLNDAAALKQADVGLALSENNSNLSAAFSTKRTSLYCFIDLLKEGRKTVSNISHTFKYFALYSLIQFTNVNVLIVLEAGLTNMQFLTEDLFIATILVLVSSLTRCSSTLSKEKPIFDIFSISNICSILGLGLLQLGAQIGVVLYVRSQQWFNPERDLESTLYDFCAYCQEGNAIFLFSIILLINCILMTGNFRPDREPFYKNIGFVLIFAGLNIYANIAFLYPPARFSLFDLVKDGIPQNDLFIIWGMAWGTIIVLCLWENLFCRKLIGCLVRRAESKKNDMSVVMEEGNREGQTFEEMTKKNSTIYRKFLQQQTTKREINNFV